MGRQSSLLLSAVFSVLLSISGSCFSWFLTLCLSVCLLGSVSISHLLGSLLSPLCLVRCSSSFYSPSHPVYPTSHPPPLRRLLHTFPLTFCVCFFISVIDSRIFFIPSFISYSLSSSYILYSPFPLVISYSVCLRLVPFYLSYFLLFFL